MLDSMFGGNAIPEMKAAAVVKPTGGSIEEGRRDYVVKIMPVARVMAGGRLVGAMLPRMVERLDDERLGRISDDGYDRGLAAGGALSHGQERARSSGDGNHSSRSSCWSHSSRPRSRCSWSIGRCFWSLAAVHETLFARAFDRNCSEQPWRQRVRVQPGSGLGGLRRNRRTGRVESFGDSRGHRSDRGDVS